MFSSRQPVFSYVLLSTVIVVFPSFLLVKITHFYQEKLVQRNNSIQKLIYVLWSVRIK